MKENLLGSFVDKSTSVTIINEILNTNNIKNPNIFFDIIKAKFNKFRAKLLVEEEGEIKRTAVLNFVERLVILHYITNINDPFRNNLATRNPKTLNEIETLLQNDLQYLKTNQMQKPIINNNFSNRNKVQSYQPKFVPNKTPYHQNRSFNFKTPSRTDNLPKPEPMSVQTRLIWISARSIYRAARLPQKI